MGLPYRRPSVGNFVVSLKPKIRINEPQGTLKESTRKACRIRDKVLGIISICAYKSVSVSIHPRHLVLPGRYRLTGGCVMTTVSAANGTRVRKYE
jgi:hypothetical protein